MDTILDRWMEKGRQEAEEAFQRERELMRQNNLKKQRESIIYMLNYLLTLTEADQIQIASQLEDIDDEVNPPWVKTTGLINDAR